MTERRLLRTVRASKDRDMQQTTPGRQQRKAETEVQRQNGGCCAPAAPSFAAAPTGAASPPPEHTCGVAAHRVAQCRAIEKRCSTPNRSRTFSSRLAALSLPLAPPPARPPGGAASRLCTAVAAISLFVTSIRGDRGHRVGGQSAFAR